MAFITGAPDEVDLSVFWNNSLNFHQSAFFLNSSLQTLQKAILFINLNNSQYFEKGGTINWSNHNNFQKQLIRDFFSRTSLIIESVLFLT